MTLSKDLLQEGIFSKLLCSVYFRIYIYILYTHTHFSRFHEYRTYCWVIFSYNWFYIEYWAYTFPVIMGCTYWYIICWLVVNIILVISQFLSNPFLWWKTLCWLRKSSIPAVTLIYSWFRIPLTKHNFLHHLGPFVRWSFAIQNQRWWSSSKLLVEPSILSLTNQW